MEHTLHSYLNRRSTGELRAILKFLVYNYKHSPEEVVRTVISILQEREKDKKTEHLQELQTAWECYLIKKGKN